MMKRFDFVYIFYLLVLLSPLCIAFEISGTVSSSQSLQDVSITATNKANGMVYNTISSEGKYSLDVPAGSFSFLASPRDYFILSDWVLPSLFSVELDLDVVQDSTLNFEFEPCFTLVAQAFDSHGNVLNYTDFSSFAWATDMNQVTARATTLEVFSVGGASSTLGFSIPLGEKRIIMSQFFVMNVGNFVMQASNGTSGFSGSEEKRGEVINLNYEFAKDAFENLNEKLNSEDYKTLSTDFQSLQDLNALMGSAHDASSPSSQAEIANQVIAKAISIEDDAEMKRAARDIDLYRTSQINVKVSDENGKPVEGITVRVEQQDHEFRFGLYGGQIPEGRERLWKLMASAGINSATVDFWWIDTEPTAENVNASYVLGQKIDFLKSLGLKLRATGLFQPDPEIIPSYALQMTFDEFSRSLYNHTFNLVSTYCKEFELIEVSTDLNTLAVKMGYNSSQVLQLQQVALDAIKKAAPNVKTSVSMFNDYFAQSAFESFKGPSTSWDKTTLSPLAFSKLWIDAGQSIDQIGQQMYNGGNRAAIGSPQQQYDPSFSLGTLSAQLDKLSTFGKPIRVSEVAVPGVWGGNWDPSEAGFLGTVWDEESQANFITKFYTMAFSKKANKEITWWGLFDEAFAYPGGTFLDSEGQPKKGYQNLISLIKSWTTDSKVASNAQGQGKVKAFAGTYKVSAFSQGNMIGMSEMKFTEGKTLPLLVRINSKGKALFSQNPSDFNVEVVNPVAPAPIGTPIGQVGDNSPSKKMPTWAIPVVIVSGLLVISAFALLIVFIVVRRRIASERNNVEGSETPTKESKDVGLAAQDSVKYESDLEAGSDLDRRESIEGTPATWMGQPLSTVPLDESESDGESGRESETEGEREEVLSGGEKFFTAAEYFPNKESSEEERNSEDEDEEEEEEDEEEEGEQKEEEESECDEALNEKQDESEGTSSEEEKL